MSQASESALTPFRLRPVFSERIWGRHGLAPWYPQAPAETAIGEAWLTGPACVIETGPLAGKTLADAIAEDPKAIIGDYPATDFPLLLKILFPEEKLSVQVHPDDAAAQRIGQPRGKTECWYVLEAKPGSMVALGLRQGVTPEALRAAAANNTLEDLLQWLPVSVGDMVFVDAGTVHAIGPGVVMLEIQQTSDTTYRVYDYGRPRELHLDAAIGVMKPVTNAGKVSPTRFPGATRLISEQYFVADRFDMDGTQPVVMSSSRSPQCVVALKGAITITTPGEAIVLNPGEAAIVPVGSPFATIKSSGPAAFVHTWPPSI